MLADRNREGWALRTVSGKKPGARERERKKERKIKREKERKNERERETERAYRQSRHLRTPG